MESRAKLLGHPVHPMLIVLPLGLFIGGVVFDLLYGWTQSRTFALVGYVNIAAGIVGGLAAAVFGLIDWLAIPPNTRAKRIGLIHGVTNVVVVLTFAAAWYMRWTSGDVVASAAVLWIEVVGLALGTVGGWLGGELVDVLAVGVDDGANLNSPNSLARPRRRVRS